MDEARREARRIRILENSEKRLQRILGVASSKEDPAHQQQADADVPVLSQRKQEISTESVKSTKTPAVENFENVSRQRFNVIEKQQPTVERAPEIPGYGKYSFETMDTVSQELPSPIGVKPAEQVNKNNVTILVLMAVTVIALLSTGFGLIICHNALLPFILYEVYLMMFPQEASKQPGSVVTAVLMLSGLPKEKLAQLTKTVQGLQAFFQDLCVYLFVCIISFKMFEAVM